MFQLFRSRRQGLRIVLGLIVASMAISMVVTLIPGIFGSSSSPGSDAVLAEVGGDAITLRDAQLQLEKASRARGLPPGAARFLAPQVVGEMVAQRALMLEAERLGLTVSDKELVDLLRTAIPMLFPGGNFVGRAQYEAFIEQKFERTVADFESLLKEDVTTSKLRRLVVDGVVLAPGELEQDYKRQNEKVRIEFAAITPASVEASLSIAPAEVEEHFKKSRTTYTLPERRSFQYVVIDDAKVAGRVQATAQELQRYYSENKDRFRVQDRVHVTHLLFKTTDKKEDEVKTTEAKAQEVLKQVKAGKDFAGLAKANSEDTASAAKGGDIGWVTRGQTVPEFEQKAFSMQPGEVSDLVKTQYGLHIIKVLEKETARVKPFSEVEAGIRQEILRDRMEAEKSRLSESVRAAANKNAQNLDAAGRELGLPVFSAKLAERTGTVPEAGSEPALMDSVFNAAKGVVVGPVVMPAKSVIAVVTEIAPSRQAELNEVADRVRNDVLSVKARDAAEARAKQLLERAKALDGDLKKAAKEFGAEVKTSEPFTREGSIPGLGGASTVGAAFTSPPHSVHGPVSAGADQVVYKIVERQEADMQGFEAASKQLRETLLGSRQNEAFEVFKDELRERLKKQGKIKIYQDRVDRFVAASRG